VRVLAPSRLGAGVLALSIAWSPASAAPGGAKGLCATAAGTRSAPPYLGIVSAFPAELAPLLEATAVERTTTVGGRKYYVGRLEGVSVVLALTGIGLVNAFGTARTMIARFPLGGLVMSGVAGGPRIGDVVLAARWVEVGRRGRHEANPALLALARRGGATLPPLERCTPVPPTDPAAPLVCLGFSPAMLFLPHGQSDDPFQGEPFPCQPGGDPVFGCEVSVGAAAAATPGTGATAGGSVTAAGEPGEGPPDVVDMESAAVARAAARRRVPYVAVRAASDGPGDPLGDRGFPLQFFDYYRLAARNAALVTRAIVGEVGRLGGDPSARGVCRLLAGGRWRRAAERIAQAQ
jgi:hypothetical protein